MNNFVCLIFSKDRAMQLHAAIESLRMHCDEDVHTHVLYKASNRFHQGQYEQLQSVFPDITFHKETDFKRQVLDVVNDRPSEYIMFLVDDAIFVQSFSVREIIESLQANDDAIGFSLRLGINTTYCYPKNVFMHLPAFERDGKFARVVKYDWTKAEYDFGYPLEVCSSVYRKHDLLSLLTHNEYSNPNTLEERLAANMYFYRKNRNMLLCYEQSIAFTNPINIVQDVTVNRSGNAGRHTASNLAEMFEDGYRIDVGKYRGLVPNSCHQEAELILRMCDKEK